jgi:hypothetical protein
MRKRLSPKKILVASLGIGAVSYVTACGGESRTSGGNLMPPQDDAGQADAAKPADAGPDVIITGGNLMPVQLDSGKDSAADAGAGDAEVLDSGADVVTSGNLVPPQFDGG